MDKPIIVVDTSFIVDIQSWQYWTEGIHQTGLENFSFISPYEVDSEYEHLLVKKEHLRDFIVQGPSLVRHSESSIKNDH